MNGESSKTKSFRFDDFRLDAESQTLSANGREIHLPKRPFFVLAYLIENRERIVSRNDLLDKFWDGHEVYDDALRKTVGAIRKALDDLEKPARFIETHYGSGYRFIGAVEEIAYNGKINAEAAPLSSQTLPVAETKDREKSSPGFRYIFASILAISLVSLVALGFYTFRQRVSPVKQSNSLETAAKKYSIAVLPLKNLTGDPANDYLSDGVTESLINELARIENLKVISRSSVFEFKNQDATAQKIGAKLGVETILEGSLKRSGDKIRVEVRLVNTNDGSVIWTSDLQEKNIGNIFAIQDEIVCRLVADLKVKICGDVPPAERYTKNVKVYQLYLKGLFYRNTPTPENLKKAVSFFEEALKIEPNYALAHEGLATTYMVMEFNSQVPPGTAAPKALFHAEKALAQDDSLANANIVLGAVKTLKNYDLAERERYYTQALLKNPNNRTARLWRSNIYLARGEFERAESEILQVQAIDPLSYGVWVSLCELYLYWRKPDKAIEQANLILATKPEDEVAFLMLAKAFLQKGELEKAAGYLEKSPDSTKNSRDIILAKDKTEARRLIEKFAETEPGKNSPYWVASYYGYIGDNENAFAWLEKSYARRQADLISLKIDPNFDGLRGDARYRDLIKRLNLE